MSRALAHFTIVISTAAGSVSRRRASRAIWGFYLLCSRPTRRRFTHSGVTGRTGLGMVCVYGEVEIVEGVQKNVIDCNWKIAVDNLFGPGDIMCRTAMPSADAAGFFEIAKIHSFPGARW